MNETTEKYLSTAELAARYRRTKRTIERWVEARGFPRPALAGRGYGSLWLRTDVERWEAEEMEKVSGASEVPDY